MDIGGLDDGDVKYVGRKWKASVDTDGCYDWRLGGGLLETEIMGSVVSAAEKLACRLVS